MNSIPRPDSTAAKRNGKVPVAAHRRRHASITESKTETNQTNVLPFSFS
jgi:hypothetical protein